VLSRALLRAGHPVFPVTRATDLAGAARTCPTPLLAVCAVAEADLAPLLPALPTRWADRLCLVQNELLPADWSPVPNPTVISVWFEKKRGQAVKVIIPSPVYGPGAAPLAQALEGIGIPARVLASPEELLFELVVKNLYILTSNLAGLTAGGTVGELWAHHAGLTRALAGDIIDLQEGLTGRHFDRAALLAAMLRAFEGDPGHRCMGRSAPARLERALGHADRLHLAVPSLRAIARERSG